MKKLFSLMLALVTVLAVNAVQVVFDFSDPTSLGIVAPAAGAGTNITSEIVVDEVTMTATSGSTATRVWNSNGVYDLRVYKTGSITFVATDEITAIEFTGKNISFTAEGLTGKVWTGSATEVTFTASGTCNISKVTLTIGETIEVWKPDTVTVAQARALIDSNDVHDHFVKGIVAAEPYNTYADFGGKVNFWLLDDLQSSDSLQAYQVYDKNNVKWASLAAAQEELNIGDTVLVYASKLELYQAKGIYEINGGYYAEKIGAAPVPPVDTLSVAEAVAIASDLAVNTVSTKYYIEGYAVNVAAYYQPKGNQDFYIVDDAAAPDSVLMVYRGVPTKEGQPYPVLAGDKVRLFGALQKYQKDTTVAAKLEVVTPTIEFLEEVEGDRTIEEPEPEVYDTITVAQALAIGQALDSAGVTETMYVIGGYVSSIINYYDTVYKNETFWMADSLGSRAASNAAGAFEVYRGKPNTEAEIGLDAFVYVTAKIQNYHGNTIETSGTPAVNVVTPGHDEIIEPITVARALEIGAQLAKGEATGDRYEITGYVSNIAEAYSTQYGNETFWITDSMGSRAASNANGAFEIYRGKPNTGAEIGSDAKIKIVCKIKKHTNGVVENDGTNVVFEVLEQGHEETFDTITVAQALAIGQALDSAGVTDVQYVVKGYVSNIVNYYDSTYKNETFWMADSLGSRAASNAAGAFEVYRGKPDTESEIGLDAYVYVKAKIQNFRGNTIETSGTPEVTVVIPGHEEIIEPITVAQAVEIGLALGSGEVTGDRYEITGYVSNIVDYYSTQYGNETFWITDSMGSRASGAANGAFEVYRGKPNTGAEIGLDAKIKIVCKIKNYNGTIENDGVNIVFEVLEQGHEETFDTITVAQALAIGQALDSAAVTDVQYIIKGYVSSIVNYYDSTYKNETFWMTDSMGSRAASNATGAFEVYRGKPDTEAEIGLDAYVYVKAKIQNFRGSVVETSGTPEVTVVIPGHEDVIEVVTVAEAIAIGAQLDKGGVTDNRYEITGYVSNIVDYYSEQYGNETFWITDSLGSRASSNASGAFEIYRGKPNTGAEIGLDAKIKIVCKIKKHTNGVVENDGTNVVFEVLEQGHEETIDTISVAQALAIGQALDSAGVTDNLYVIKGYVSNIVNYYDSIYKNETFWMADSLGSRAASNAAGAFEVYRGKPDTEAEIGLDAYVYVKAKIQNFKGTIIETSGTPEVTVVTPGKEEVIESITVAQAVEIGLALGNGGVSDNRYEITGYVSAIVDAFSEQYGNETFWITDEEGAMVTGSANGAFEVYRGKPNTGAEIGWNAQIKIVCKIKNYNGTIENDGTGVLFEVLKQGEEITVDTLTVAEAMEETAKLPAGSTSAKFYAVKGYIVSISAAYDEQYGNMSFYMDDDYPSDLRQFQCYRAKISAEDAEKAVAGAYVIVTGHLDNNSHGMQMSQGSEVAIGEAPAMVTITVAEAVAIGQKLAEGAETEKNYHVKGYVINASAYDEDNEFQNFFMADDAKATSSDFQAFRAKVAEPGVQNGQEVVLTGKITKYVTSNGTIIIQIAHGQVESIEGIENIELTEQAQKILLNGVLYIVRDNKMYNVQGIRVR